MNLVLGGGDTDEKASIVGSNPMCWATQYSSNNTPYSWVWELVLSLSSLELWGSHSSDSESSHSQRNWYQEWGYASGRRNRGPLYSHLHEREKRTQTFLYRVYFKDEFKLVLVPQCLAQLLSSRLRGYPVPADSLTSSLSLFPL